MGAFLVVDMGFFKSSVVSVEFSTESEMTARTANAAAAGLRVSGDSGQGFRTG